MEKVDFAICGGRIIDPATGREGIGNIGVRGGKIACIDMDSPMTFDPEYVVRADGCIVIPGMIDCHVHAYEHATPLGVNIDDHCLARGVTTVVDAGSAGQSSKCQIARLIHRLFKDPEMEKKIVLSLRTLINVGLPLRNDDVPKMREKKPKMCTNCHFAMFQRKIKYMCMRASTFPGLRKFIAERSNTRLLCFLHIASHGLAAAGCSAAAGGGECDHLNQVDVAKCVECVRQNSDMIVGIKVRVSISCTDNGRVEEEVYRRALTAAEESGVPLMAHHTISSIPTYKLEGKLSCPLDMRNGDIYTHTYNCHPSHILNEEGTAVLPDVWAARKKGIYFDVGHGRGSFSWPLTEIATSEEFWPDVISTDLHTVSFDGPAYDLPMVMTKFHALGMPLNDVIASVTSRPAAAIKRSETLGCLKVGREADISMMKIEDWGKDLEDCEGQVRKIKKRFVPVGVWRNGKRFNVTPHPNCPNIESRKRAIQDWDMAEVRDAEKPSIPKEIV